MRIKEKYVDFSSEIVIGRLSYFIILDRYGIEIPIKDLSDEISNFSYIVVKSVENDDIMNQADELLTFMKTVIKKNEHAHFCLFTDGLKNFRGFTPSSLTMNVEMKLSKTGIELEKRINPKSLAWYIAMNSNFVFDIENENEFDEACMIIHEHGIKKHNVLINPTDNFDKIKALAKANSFNIGLRMVL